LLLEFAYSKWQTTIQERDMNIKAALSALLLSGLWFSASEMAVAADLARYNIELLVSSVSFSPQSASCSDTLPIPYSGPSFGCLKVGDVYHGSFGVDAAILSTDGIVSDVPIFDFELAIGDMLLTTNGPDYLTRVGFRNRYGLGAIAPSFLIEDGQIVDLIGDAYGSGDGFGVEWSMADAPLSGRFSRNWFETWGGGNGARGITATGTLSLQRIPEPGSLALLGLAFGGLAVFRRKRMT
jgi:hypothetical protein